MRKKRESTARVDTRNMSTGCIAVRATGGGEEDDNTRRGRICQTFVVPTAVLDGDEIRGASTSS